jgi:rubrerythrin
MAENKALDIIKKALLIEYRGKCFYENAAKNSENEGVKEIFEMMVDEEEHHAEILTDVFKDVSAGNIMSVDLCDKPADISSEVLTEKVKDAIDASGYESAAISAAIAMENEAIEFYTKSAKTADTEEEKKLYSWLADWEKNHAKYLTEVDKQIMEDIWYDNNFWPLD